MPLSDRGKTGTDHASAGIAEGVSSTSVHSLRQRSAAPSPSRRFSRRGSRIGSSLPNKGSAAGITLALASTVVASDCRSLERADSSTWLVSSSPRMRCSDPPVSTYTRPSRPPYQAGTALPPVPPGPGTSIQTIVLFFSTSPSTSVGEAVAYGGSSSRIAIGTRPTSSPPMRKTSSWSSEESTITPCRSSLNRSILLDPALTPTADEHRHVVLGLQEPVGEQFGVGNQHVGQTDVHRAPFAFRALSRPPGVARS